MITDIKTFARTYIAIGIAISALAIIQTQQQTEALLKIRTRYKWVLLMAFFALYVVVGLYLVLRRHGAASALEKLEAGLSGGKWMRVLAGLLILLPLPILWYAHADFYGRGLDAFFRLLWLFWLLALLQTVGWKVLTHRSWPTSLAFGVLLDGMLLELYTLFLPVTDYPFSAGWSEASRFYYGSLVFSRSI